MELSPNAITLLTVAAGSAALVLISMVFSDYIIRIMEALDL